VTRRATLDDFLSVGSVPVWVALPETVSDRRQADRVRVVTYLRVSTGDQVRSGLGLDAQRAALAEAGERAGWDGAEMLFQVSHRGRREKFDAIAASNESFSGWTKTFTDPRLCGHRRPTNLQRYYHRNPVLSSYRLATASPKAAWARATAKAKDGAHP
jgi:hypothetical protein